MLFRLADNRIPVSLRRLFPACSFVGCADVQVTEATDRSSECRPEALFVAIKGAQADGAQYVDEAIERGATAILVERPMTNVSVRQCVVPNVRRAYAVLCGALSRYTQNDLRVAGVTGTNGKTTTTWLIRSILQAAGNQTGLLGTVEYSDGVRRVPSTLTTPDPKSFFSWLSAMVNRGTTHVACEMSSHALVQDRVAGLTLDTAIVTNVTQDHFDYHGDYNSYLNSKAKIVEYVRKRGVVVLNADDPGSSSLRERVSPEVSVITYGLEGNADVSADLLDESLQGSRFQIRIEQTRFEVVTPLIGRHNISNCLAAAAACMHFGVQPRDIATGIASLAVVPGRLEPIYLGQPFRVFVDYAHTEDALRHAITSLRRLSSGRVICVFGAGGDRDRTKRPKMGAAAAEADLAVITSDNPRTEAPEQIMEDILAGFPADQHKPHVEVDRAAAIEWALGHAEAGDAVLIAGKGHESVQCVGTQRLPFDDREVARNILSRLNQPTERIPARMPA